MAIICCKLPNGLIIEHPSDPNKTVALNGANSSKIIGSEVGTTTVNDDFWKAWAEANKDFPAFKSGAIWEGKTADAVEPSAKERKKNKTGLEALDPDLNGVTIAK